jgi:hypothetical protein
VTGRLASKAVIVTGGGAEAAFITGAALAIDGGATA